MSIRTLALNPDRYFDPDPAQKSIAGMLYEIAARLPLICPHGHVDARLFADPEYKFGTPVDALIIPDHYVFRMLYSQGITLDQLGISRLDGASVEQDHRKVWQTFADHFYLFRGTPTGLWLTHELYDVFRIDIKLTSATAPEIYARIQTCLDAPEYHPRRLYERFNIAVLATTDAAHQPLHHHRAIRESGWGGRVIPTFRPDGVINLDTPEWKKNINELSLITGIDVHNYRSFTLALETRRNDFKAHGATATDHGAYTPYTTMLSEREADNIFQRALKSQISVDDVARFTGFMLCEMARMSVDDGLVMQLHVGSHRDHNPALLRAFGKDKGADIPIQMEFTRNLQPLLNQFGTHPQFRLVLFTLDEAAYSRELAPLAGHYPGLRLGPPWWFHDSLNGMRRYFDQVIETAGLYNTAGFNDDTRAFPSIPARHDLWRRAAANWLAGLVVRGIIDVDDAQAMIVDCVHHLVLSTYKLNINLSNN